MDIGALRLLPGMRLERARNDLGPDAQQTLKSTDDYLAQKPHRMRIVLLLPLLTIASALIAQPTFTAANEPAIGSTVTTISTDYRAAGPAINGFVFNVSDLALGTPFPIQVVLPSSTPYASTFPGATYALTSSIGPESYSYVQVMSTQKLQLGQKSASQETVYTNGVQTAKFPLTLGTTWSHALAGTTTSNGATTSITGNSTGSYTSYGTVILPFGTFTNVARIELTQTENGTIQGTPVTSTVHTVDYRAAGYGTALFSSRYIVVDFGTGADTLIPNGVMIDPSMVGIRESPATITAVLAPNPANGSAILTLGASVRGLSIRMLDASGREVRSIGADTNSQRITIPVEGLAPGLYHLRATDASGATGNWPLMVQ